MPPSHLPRPSSRSRDWTAAERLTLRKLWRTASDAELLAALPGRTGHSVANFAARTLKLSWKDRPASTCARLMEMPAHEEESR